VKIVLLSCVLFSLLVCVVQADPRYRPPTTPEEILQNDRDLEELIDRRVDAVTLTSTTLPSGSSYYIQNLGTASDEEFNVTAGTVTTLSVNVIESTGGIVSILFDSDGAVDIRGAIDGNSPPSGFVGEVVRSVQSSNQTCPTSGQYGDVTSISISSGNWMLYGMVRYNIPTASDVTALEMGISVDSGNSFTDLTVGNWVPSTNSSAGTAATDRILAARMWEGVVVGYPIQILSDDIYYLKFLAAYSGSGCFGVGTIAAMRRP